MSVTTSEALNGNLRAASFQAGEANNFHYETPSWVGTDGEEADGQNVVDENEDDYVYKIDHQVDQTRGRSFMDIETHEDQTPLASPEFSNIAIIQQVALEPFYWDVQTNTNTGEMFSTLKMRDEIYKSATERAYEAVQRASNALNSNRTTTANSLVEVSRTLITVLEEVKAFSDSNHIRHMFQEMILASTSAYIAGLEINALKRRGISSGKTKEFANADYYKAGIFCYALEELFGGQFKVLFYKNLKNCIYQASRLITYRTTSRFQLEPPVDTQPEEDCEW